MALNLLVLVSIIYCTSAYVTVNVLEEGQDTLSQEFSHCEYYDCDNFCKRLGYQSGTCVDGHCKCNYKQADDATIVKECTPAMCNRLCRRMGFPDGDCINNRCECQKLVDILDTDSSSIRRCHSRECDRLCRRFGFRSGACVGDRCKCDNFRASEGIADTENNNDLTFDAGDTDVNQLRSCNLRACEQLCRWFGFRSGACVGDRCKCDNFRASESIADTENNNDLTFDAGDTDVNQLRSCNLRACEQLCRWFGFRSGACVGDRCKCDNFRASEGIADTENNNDLTFDAGDTDVNQLRSCNLRACEQLCRWFGFRSGACVGDRCKCDNFRASEGIADTENNNDLTFDAGDMDVNQLRSCNLRACEQLCRRLGFPGGACVGDRCKCDNFRTSKDEYSEAASTLRDCNYQECDQRCRRLGFPGGACVGSRYKYSAKINTEYRSCNYRECDRRCRRLKFPGGACVNNQCKCYNFRQLLSNEESLATNTIDNPLENDVKCDLTQCKTSCSERGLRNSICIEKECYCDMEDAETSSLPCEPHACNDSCQIMNRLGGFCLLGKCICY